MRRHLRDADAETPDLPGRLDLPESRIPPDDLRALKGGSLLKGPKLAKRGANMAGETHGTAEQS